TIPHQESERVRVSFEGPGAGAGWHALCAGFRPVAAPVSCPPNGHVAVADLHTRTPFRARRVAGARGASCIRTGIGGRKYDEQGGAGADLLRASVRAAAGCLSRSAARRPASSTGQLRRSTASVLRTPRV